MDVLTGITGTSRTYSRGDALSLPCPLPKARGIYSWNFKTIPGVMPADKCVTSDGLSLLHQAFLLQRPRVRRA